MSASTQGSVLVRLQIVHTQRADGVEDREHHHADICKDSRPHVGRAKGNERKAGSPPNGQKSQASGPVIGDVLKRLVIGDTLEQATFKERPRMPALRDVPKVPAHK